MYIAVHGVDYPEQYLSPIWKQIQEENIPKSEWQKVIRANPPPSMPVECFAEGEEYGNTIDLARIATYAQLLQALLLKFPSFGPVPDEDNHNNNNNNNNN